MGVLKTATIEAGSTADTHIKIIANAEVIRTAHSVRLDSSVFQTDLVPGLNVCAPELDRGLALLCQCSSISLNFCRMHIAEEGPRHIRKQKGYGQSHGTNVSEVGVKLWGARNR